MPRCNSLKCGGCYEVESGVWVHPPKDKITLDPSKRVDCNEEYLARWIQNENRALDKQND